MRPQYREKNCPASISRRVMARTEIPRTKLAKIPSRSFWRERVVARKPLESIVVLKELFGGFAIPSGAVLLTRRRSD